MPKKALITGITGQDGSYLTELLLSRGYDVYGVIRRASTFNTERIDHIYQDPHESGRRLRLLYGDLNDASSLNKILRDVQPDEIYNLGAQSHVRVSFDIPEYTAEVDARDAPVARGDTRNRVARDAVLSGLVVGAFRKGPGGPAARNDPVLSAQPLQRRQTLRLLDHGELSRKLRAVRVTVSSSTMRASVAKLS